jgi:hypothetical protein
MRDVPVAGTAALLVFLEKMDVMTFFACHALLVVDALVVKINDLLVTLGAGGSGEAVRVRQRGYRRVTVGT